MDEKGGKIKVNQEKNVSKVSESTNLENTVQIPPLSVKVSNEVECLFSLTLFPKLCESETECESVSEVEEMELDQGSVHEQDRVSNAREEEKEAESNLERAERGDSFLPEETIDRKESVELWKSRNETDVIGEYWTQARDGPGGWCFTPFSYFSVRP